MWQWHALPDRLQVAQLGYGSLSGRTPEAIAAAHPHGLGGSGLGTLDVDRRNGIQSAIMNRTRLHIPVSFFGETTHSGGMVASILSYYHNFLEFGPGLLLQPV